MLRMLLFREGTRVFDIFFLSPTSHDRSLVDSSARAEIWHGSAVQIAILFTNFMRTAAQKIQIVPVFDVEMKRSTD